MTRFIHTKDAKAATLRTIIEEHISKDVQYVMTDESSAGYSALKDSGKQMVIRHSIGSYVNGIIHTNTVESAFSLLMRGIVGNFHKIYPLVELHYMHYTRNGNQRTLHFEGADLFNFGANGVGGRDELRLAGGFRYQHNQHFSTGIAGEFGLLGGGNHLDGSRVTFDMIFRY